MAGDADPADRELSEKAETEYGTDIVKSRRRLFIRKEGHQRCRSDSIRTAAGGERLQRGSRGVAVDDDVDDEPTGGG